MNYQQWQGWLADERTQEFMKLADEQIAQHSEYLTAPGLTAMSSEDLVKFVSSTNGVINGVRQLLSVVEDRAQEPKDESH